jgi:hypothetical protein
MWQSIRCTFGYHREPLRYIAHGLVLAVYACPCCYRLIRLPLR